MDADTLKALKGSIKKWEKIVAKELGDKGVNNCPLCERFLLSGDLECGDCPVGAKTGRGGCVGSPYGQWMEHRLAKHGISTGSILCEECRTLARAELRFLVSLLPKVRRSK